MITPFAPHALPKLLPEDVAEIRDNYFSLHSELFPTRAKSFTRIVQGTPRQPLKGENSSWYPNLMLPLNPTSFNGFLELGRWRHDFPSPPNAICEQLGSATPQVERTEAEWALDWEERLKDISPPNEDDLIFDKYTYFTQFKKLVPRFKEDKCAMPRVGEITLADCCLTKTEREPHVVVPFGYQFKGAPLTTPKPQPPPAPLQNAEHYRELSVPNVRLKTSARTDAGIKRFREKSQKLWADRRFAFWLWSSILQKCCQSCGASGTKKKVKEKIQGKEITRTACAQCGNDWKSLQDSRGNRTFCGWDSRDNCSRCGSSVFAQSSRYLVCYDCGKNFRREFRDYASSDAFVREIYDDGKPKTGESRETHKGDVPSRERWLAPIRMLFNPTGKKWGEVTADDILDGTNNPDFPQTALEYEINFGNMTKEEAAEQLGIKAPALRKRISRQEPKQPYHDMDFSQTIGKYFCVVSLHGRKHLKILGDADTPLMDVLKTFFVEWEKSETNAVKQARKDAKSEGVSKQVARKWEQEAAERIQDAYAVVIELVVPDSKPFGCTFYYFTKDELVEAAVRARGNEVAFQTLALSTG